MAAIPEDLALAAALAGGEDEPERGAQPALPARGEGQAAAALHRDPGRGDALLPHPLRFLMALSIF